jgi:hypothetical protein
MIGGYMMDGYTMVAGMGWTGSTALGLLWIVAIALLAWSLVYLPRTQQQRMRPAALEIEKWRDQPRYVRERRRQ